LRQLLKRYIRISLQGSSTVKCSTVHGTSWGQPLRGAARTARDINEPSARQCYQRIATMCCKFCTQI